MAVKSTNTMIEALQGILTDLSMMKTMPDADLQWIISLETTILQKIKEPITAAQGQMPGGPAGPPPGGGMQPGQPGPPPGAPPGGMPPMGGPGMAGPPFGGRGLQMSPGAPPPDEIRRMVQQPG